MRPNRPWELDPTANIAPEVKVDGVRYIHSRWPSSHTPNSEQAHLQASVDTLVALFRVFRPAAVLAASNWQVGLPAWIAAKRLGLPFYYEVRGFWEISKISRDAAWKDTNDYQRHYTYETWVCNQADKLFTLNRFMQEELIKRGVSAEQIDLVPNSIETLPELKQVNNANLRESLGIPKEAFVLGYVGAITEYEGLELLIEALAKTRSHSTHALIVGGYSPVHGSSKKEKIVQQLENLAERLGVSEYITFIGRVPYESLGDYFGVIDATVIPRKPLAVCELVSALKPLEYLGWGKPVIASDVAPQAEVLKQGELGWLFAKGDSDALAATISEVVNTPQVELSLIHISEPTRPY